MISSLQPYDFFMLAVLLFFTLYGVWKGMAWQIASLASLVLSTAVAIHFSAPLAPYFSRQEPWNRFIAMLVLYLLTSLGVWYLFRIVAGAISRVHMKDFDRQAGGLLGAAKGVLWCLVITFFAVTLSESARQVILTTRSGYYMAVLLKHAAPVLPQEVRSVVGSYVDELNRKLDPQQPANSPGPLPAEKSTGRTQLSAWLRERLLHGKGAAASPPAGTSPAATPAAAPPGRSP